MANEISLELLYSNADRLIESIETIQGAAELLGGIYSCLFSCTNVATLMFRDRRANDGVFLIEKALLHIKFALDNLCDHHVTICNFKSALQETIISIIQLINKLLHIKKQKKLLYNLIDKCIHIIALSKIQKNEWNNALFVLEITTDEEELNMKSMFLISSCYVAQYDFNKALEIFSNIKIEVCSYFPLVKLYAQLQAFQGNTEKAMSFLDKCIEGQSYLPAECMAIKATLLAILGKFDKSIYELSKSIELSSQLSESFMNLVPLFIQKTKVYTISKIKISKLIETLKRKELNITNISREILIFTFFFVDKKMITRKQEIDLEIAYEMAMSLSHMSNNYEECIQFGANYIEREKKRKTYTSNSIFVYKMYIHSLLKCDKANEAIAACDLMINDAHFLNSASKLDDIYFSLCKIEALFILEKPLEGVLLCDKILSVLSINFETKYTTDGPLTKRQRIENSETDCLSQYFIAAINNKAVALISLERNEEARDLLTKLTEFNSHTEEAYFNLSLLQMKLRNITSNEYSMAIRSWLNFRNIKVVDDSKYYITFQSERDKQPFDRKKNKVEAMYRDLDSIFIRKWISILQNGETSKRIMMFDSFFANNNNNNNNRNKQE